MTGGRYHRVFSRIWTSADFRRWTDDGRLAALYVLTCPHRNTEGLFRLPLPLAQHDLGWTTERTTTALAELERSDFIATDPDADLVWLVNAVKWNTPKGPKQIKGAVNALADVPSSMLRARYLEHCRQHCPELADAIEADLGWDDRYPIEGVSKGYPDAVPDVSGGEESPSAGADPASSCGKPPDQGEQTPSIPLRYPFDCSSSFSSSSSSSTPPTPPTPDAVRVQGVEGEGVAVEEDGGGGSEIVDSGAVRIADQILTMVGVLDEGANGDEIDRVAQLLELGWTEPKLLELARIARSNPDARNPRRYLFGILGKRVEDGPLAAGSAASAGGWQAAWAEAERVMAGSWRGVDFATVGLPARTVAALVSIRRMFTDAGATKHDTRLAFRDAWLAGEPVPP